MKNTLLLLLILSVVKINAQINFFAPDTTTRQLFLNGYGGIGSDAISQEFLNKFIFPDYIDNDLKTSVSEKLKENNRFGGGFNFDVQFYMPKGSLGENGFWGISANHSTEGNLGFRKELFDLTFFGNQPYAGQTLDISNTNFNTFSYSSINLTLGKIKETKKGVRGIWMDIGAVLGHNYTEFSIDDASIFTEEFGNYIDVNIQNSSFIVSDTLTTNLFTGLGGKLNLNYSFNTEKSRILLQVQNIGVIHWNTSTNANLDTTFRFEGVEIDNLFIISDSILQNITSRDSLLNKNNDNYTQVLPVDFNVYGRTQINALIDADIFVKHRLFANYTPFARAGIYFKLPIVTLGASAAYGGYGGMQTGLNAEIKFLKTIKLNLGTNNLLGALIPANSTSFDAFVGMRMSL